MLEFLGSSNIDELISKYEEPQSEQQSSENDPAKTTQLEEKPEKEEESTKQQENKKEIPEEDSYEITPREEGQSYEEWLAREYMKDPRINSIEKASFIVKKQKEKHQAMSNYLSSVATEGDVIVSAGSGSSHEQAFLPNYNWIGLEHDPTSVDFANKTRREWGQRGANKVWDVYTDDLPNGDVLYLSHFCGGGTDGSMSKAIKKGYKGIVALTCCSNRLQDISHEVYKDYVDPKDWDALAKQSQNKANLNISIPAQKQIDEIRATYLRDNGYDVQTNWLSDSKGNPLPAGGVIVAKRVIEKPEVSESNQESTDPGFKNIASIDELILKYSKKSGMPKKAQKQKTIVTDEELEWLNEFSNEL